jgi:hypothetical protein
MTNGDAIRALIGCAILTAFLGLILFEIERWKMTQPQPQQPETQPHCWAVKSPDDRYEQSPAMAIMWRTPNADGMAPLSVLRSAAKRMQYEQGTPLGNDQAAKALVKVLEAVAILEGRETVTAEGFPIIE